MCGTNQGKTRKTCENQENSHPKIAQKMYIKCARNVDIITKENKDKKIIFISLHFWEFMAIICTLYVHLMYIQMYT